MQVSTSHALGKLLVIAWILLQTQGVGAQPAPGLSVAREPGSEDCPDTERLTERVFALTEEQARAESDYSIVFSRTPEGYRASIRGAGGTSRVLEDQGETCSALEQAAAITLALLLDDAASDEAEEAAPPPPEKPAPVEPPAPEAPAVELRQQTEPSPREGTGLVLSVAGGGLFGVVRTVSPAVMAAAGVALDRVHLHLGALWMLPQTLDVGPGTVEETLVSGTLRACVVTVGNAHWSLDACSGAHVGQLRASSDGYTVNKTEKRLQLTLPVELAAVRRGRRYQVALSAAALLALRRTDFVVEGFGLAYRSWPVGALLALRIAYLP